MAFSITGLRTPASPWTTRDASRRPSPNSTPRSPSSRPPGSTTSSGIHRISRRSVCVAPSPCRRSSATSAG
jgi:hypothetical protein